MPARVVLTGLPTAGKSRVGQLLAKRLGVPFVDVDATVEAEAGCSIAQLFNSRGEALFRELEAAATSSALRVDQAVVALGGGAITTPAVQDMLAGVTVIWLDVSVAEATRRQAGQSSARPLLAGDAASRLAALKAARAGLYAAASRWRIDTDGLSCGQVADRVLGLLKELAVVEVATAAPYDVVIGHGALARLAPVVAGASQVAVIASQALASVASQVVATVEAAGVRAHLLSVPVGEAAKTSDVLATCWQGLAEAGFTRSDLVVGVGGGATTDLAGLVAATYLRGVGWVGVPTTVLGMVDAGVGGKTGIDLPQGKNLVGAFHEPLAVLADLDTLDSLPVGEVRSGLAEVVKVGFTDDPSILDLIETDPVGALDVASGTLAQLILKGVRVKAGVVATDLRERTTGTGPVGRERLNYGHTMAHAIETFEHYTWRHGPAVAVGAVYAAEVARRVLGLSSDLVARHRQSFASLGLPISYSQAPWDDLRQLIARDKKARGASVRMVLLRDIADVALVANPPEDDLRAAYVSINQ